jgi:hypothetical protein
MCVQCVLLAGGTRTCETAEQSVDHLRAHRQLGHAIDSNLVQFLGRVREEEAVRDQRRIADVDLE